MTCMKRALFPVMGVLLLSLCLVNRKDSVFSISKNVSYQQPDTTDINNPVRLYSRGKRINAGNSNEWAYR
jgi:hypothetical protein